MLRKIYHQITRPVHEKWLGSLQAGAVIRSLHIQHSLKQILAQQTRPVVLDAGCGSGAAQTLVYARRYPDCRFVAVDYYNQIPAGYSLHIPENITLIESDLFAYDCPQGTFDLVICADVLEHLEEDEKLVGFFRHWLKRDGRLVLHVPSKGQKEYFRGVRPIRRQGAASLFGDHHVREGYGLEDLKRILEKNNFRIVDHRYTFSSLSRFVKEVAQGMDNIRFRGIGLLMMPFLCLSTAFEIHFKQKGGNGILVVAETVP